MRPYARVKYFDFPWVDTRRARLREFQNSPIALSEECRQSEASREKRGKKEKWKKTAAVSPWIEVTPVWRAILMCKMID